MTLLGDSYQCGLSYRLHYRETCALTCVERDFWGDRRSQSDQEFITGGRLFCPLAKRIINILNNVHVYPNHTLKCCCQVGFISTCFYSSKIVPTILLHGIEINVPTWGFSTEVCVQYKRLCLTVVLSFSLILLELYDFYFLC